MKFQVEFVFADKRPAYLFARKLSGEDFTLSDSSRLGEARIRPILSMPRAVKRDGSPDLDLFAFVIIDAEDVRRFHQGQVVELVP